MSVEFSDQHSRQTRGGDRKEIPTYFYFPRLIALFDPFGIGNAYVAGLENFTNLVAHTCIEGVRTTMEITNNVIASANDPARETEKAYPEVSQKALNHQGTSKEEELSPGELNTEDVLMEVNQILHLHLPPR